MSAKSYDLNIKDNADYDEEHIHNNKGLTEISPESRGDSVTSDMIEVDIEHVDLLFSYETGDNLTQPNLKKHIKVNPSKIEAVSQEQYLTEESQCDPRTLRTAANAPFDTTLSLNKSFTSKPFTFVTKTDKPLKRGEHCTF